MGLDATIRRPDRAPLGDAARVKTALSVAFPDLLYTYVDRPTPVRLPLLLRLFVRIRRTPYPHWHGLVQTDRFAAEFVFPAEAAVPSIGLTLYGRGTASAEPHLAQLRASTGWEVVYDG